jgi:hypothetical protein
MDELQSLFVNQPGGLASSVDYVQGTIRSWTSTSGANVVELPGGTQLRNVKILNASVFTSFSVGDSVGLLLINNQYTIVGKIKSAGNGLESVQYNSVHVLESTTSTSFTDLATVGPSVTTYIGPSRACIVLIGGLIFAANNIAYMSCSVGGANSIAPGAAVWSPAQYGPPSTASAYSQTTCTALNFLTGLNQGMTTFTAKYAIDGTLLASFNNRNIMVMPL